MGTLLQAVARIQRVNQRGHFAKMTLNVIDADGERGRVFHDDAAGAVFSPGLSA
jgi:hypothetical protein